MAESRNRRFRKSTDAEATATPETASEETEMATEIEIPAEETESTEDNADSVSETESDEAKLERLNRLLSDNAHDPLATGLIQSALTARNTILEQNKRATAINDAKKKTSDSEIVSAMEANEWNDAHLKELLTYIAEDKDLIEAAQKRIAEHTEKGLAIARTFMNLPSDEDIAQMRAVYDENLAKVSAQVEAVKNVDTLITSMPNVPDMHLVSVLPELVSLSSGGRRKSIATSVGVSGGGTPHIKLLRAFYVRNPKSKGGSGLDREEHVQVSRDGTKRITNTGTVARNLQNSTSTVAADRTPITAAELAFAFMAHGNWESSTDIPDGEHEWQFTKQIGTKDDGSPITRTWDLLWVIDKENAKNS